VPYASLTLQCFVYNKVCDNVMVNIYDSKGETLYIDWSHFSVYPGLLIMAEVVATGSMVQPARSTLDT